MAARSLNKVSLIGNLTRDPELRYTPQGSAVCNLGLATNRTWTSDTGERQEETVFHRLVAWSKLAEICSQLLGKGDKVYMEGRIGNRQWEDANGVSHTVTEITITDMILLKSQRGPREPREEVPAEEKAAPKETSPLSQAKAGSTKRKKTDDQDTKQGKKKDDEEMTDEEIASDDIPF
jgi:single-strand DNA-binding protein